MKCAMDFGFNRCGSRSESGIKNKLLHTSISAKLFFELY